MRPNDYTLHVVGVNLLNATTSNKFEMMEENLKVVSSDFIKQTAQRKYKERIRVFENLWTNKEKKTELGMPKSTTCSDC